MYKFIVDTQLPPLLSEFFRYKGYDATHTTDYPNGQFMQDIEIVEIATKENRIIVSKDNDFFYLFLSEKIKIKILFLDLGNIKNNDLLKLLSKNIETIIQKFNNNGKLIIVTNKNILTY